eukprot:4094227-Pleurochrysis_carterae.AAC.5
MESDATSVDVSRVVSFLTGSLMEGFSDPNDPCRARFPQLHQPANMHLEARTNTVLIADTGPRSHPDYTNATHTAHFNRRCRCPRGSRAVTDTALCRCGQS